MPPDRRPGATQESGVLQRLLRSWPPALPEVTRGYRPLELQDSHPLAALDLKDGRAVVAAEAADRSVTALPCYRAPDGWRVARAGDGVASALLSGTPEPSDGFELRRYRGRLAGDDSERELGTDQSNISTVVGERAIVKWRTAPDADGRRSTRMRRHLQANGFDRSPALMASLTWSDGGGETWVLADVDELLPDAEDGWDHYIARLRAAVEEGADPPLPDLAAKLGALTADLHAALVLPSAIIPAPMRTAVSAEMLAIGDAGLELLNRALVIEAADQAEVRAREPVLRTALEGLPSDGTRLGPIHGDLHLGQIVAWRDGLAVIDFDGSPEPMAPDGAEDAPARDVAQMICSLWSLASVVDQRTEGALDAQLKRWARGAEHAFLQAYRDELATVGSDVLDERLLEPFIAEQLCRELLYAEAVLPRWRYAPLQALRWRYPLGADDDD